MVNLKVGKKSQHLKSEMNAHPSIQYSKNTLEKQLDQVVSGHKQQESSEYGSEQMLGQTLNYLINKIKFDQNSGSTK